MTVECPSPTVRPRSNGVDALTPREREVLAEIIAGASNKEAGRTLGISPRTVEVHRARIMDKLGAKNAADLVRIVRGGRGRCTRLVSAELRRFGTTGFDGRCSGAALIAAMASPPIPAKTRMAARRRDAVDRGGGRHRAELAGLSRRPRHRLAARRGDGGAVRPAGAYPGAAVAGHFGRWSGFRSAPWCRRRRSRASRHFR